jgi:hypothetical protein
MDRFTGTAVQFAILATCALTAACGGDDHNDPLDSIDGGPETDSGPDVDGGGALTDGPINSDGPTIQVLTPDEPAAGEYGADDIVIDARFTATCRVVANDDTGDPVDSSSVTLTAIAGGETYQVAAVPSGVTNTYEATLDVSEFPNGALAVRCTASDLASDPRTNSDEVATFLDLGPSVSILSPTAGASYGSQVDLSFVALPDPVAADDDLADVEDVTVRVGGTVIAATPTGGGSYFATIAFDDDAFDPSLDGDVAIVIEAENGRTSRIASIEFVADSDGPSIQIETPDAGQLVSGFLDISVTVNDPAGIESVVATLAQLYEVELFNTSGDTYEGSIDTRQLSTSWVFPLLAVRARDVVGNESAVGRVVALDNRAPLVTMDSPRVRDANCFSDDECDVTTDNLECSRAFDPLGSDAADDGELVGQLVELRVRTEDIGNGANAPTGVFIPIAEVDEAEVQFYVLDDSDGDLLVDTDGDGFCDDVNPALVPTTVPDAPNELAVVSLEPVNPSGESYFAATIGTVGTDAAVEDGQCVPADPPDDEAPVNICSSAALTEVISTPNEEPAIYSIPPINNSTCAGNAFDAAASNISDGWACIATVAVDKLGNVGISPPLRVCIDADGDGTDGTGGGGTLLTSLGCPDDYGEIATAGNRPDCTDGCELPLTFSGLPTKQIRVLSTSPPP